MATIRQKLTHAYYDFQSFRRRWMCACRYALDRSTIDDAYDLYLHAQFVTGKWNIETLSESDVLAMAVAKWGNHPELPDLVTRACVHVATTWLESADDKRLAEHSALAVVSLYADDAKLPFINDAKGR